MIFLDRAWDENQRESICIRLAGLLGVVFSGLGHIIIDVYDPEGEPTFRVVIGPAKNELDGCTGMQDTQGNICVLVCYTVSWLTGQKGLSWFVCLDGRKGIGLASFLYQVCPPG